MATQTVEKAFPGDLVESLVTRGFVDYWGRVRRPSVLDLIHEYKRIAYCCANLNAYGVGQIPLKLYVKTSLSQRKARCLTKVIDDSNYNRIAYLKGFSDDVNIEEVVEHPVIDLMTHVNEIQGHYYHTLMVLTQLYLDTTGKAYWRIIDNPVLGTPAQIILIPTQLMEPKREVGSRNLVDYFEYRTGGEIERISPDEIIMILIPNLMNPYLDGLSPLEAAIQSIRVSNKLISHEDSFLENEARPDAILTPGKDNSLTADEAKAWEKKFNKKFARGQAGKIMVAEDEITYTPLTVPARDLARLEIDKWSRLGIANSFDVPLALLNLENVNRNILEGAREQHAQNGIKPRLTRLENVLNYDLIPRYDDSGRLFYMFDDPVPELKAEKLQENVQLVMNGIKTPNEARKQYGMKPHPDGDELRAINVSPELAKENKKPQKTDG